MAKYRRWVWSAIVTLVVVFGGGWYFWATRVQAPVTMPQTKSLGGTPTLYLHGYSGGAVSTNTLIDRAEAAGGAKVLTATVNKAGHVSWQGAPQKVKHPLIQVIFEDNKDPDYPLLGQWLNTIAHELYSRFGVRQMNLVAHSMGNMAVMYYAMQHGHDSRVPKIKAYVAIAGHYDGVLGRDDVANRTTLDAQGKPTPVNEAYGELMRMRVHFPTGIRILNIYGDLEDGSHSDGAVANNSSLSLKYLVAGKAASYQVKAFMGKTAQHSALHENPQVAAATTDFLWGKP